MDEAAGFLARWQGSPVKTGTGCLPSQGQTSIPIGQRHAAGESRRQTPDASQSQFFRSALAGAIGIAMASGCSTMDGCRLPRQDQDLKVCFSEGKVSYQPSDPAHGCTDDSCLPCWYANSRDPSCDPECKLGPCNEGFGDCDGSDSNGCEVNLNADLPNCGECGKPCDNSETEIRRCLHGSCTVIHTCGDGLVVCENTSVCVDLSTDPKHCGTCGNICDSGACDGGRCEDAEP